MVKHYLSEPQTAPEPDRYDDKRVSWETFPAAGGESGHVPRRWHQWYARSLELEATPLEIAQPKRRRWGRFLYLALALLGIALGVNFLAQKIFLYTASGTIGVERYPLSPASTMKVARVEVHPGERVHTGQVIMRFDSPELEQQLAQTRVKIAETEAHLEQQSIQNDTTASSLKAEIEGLRSQLQALIQQYADQQSQVQTLKALAASGAASQVEVQKAQEAMVTSKSQYDAAAAKLRADRAQLRQLQKKDGATEKAASLLGSLRQLRKTLRSRVHALELRAPVDGVVAEVPVAQGQVVQAGNPAAVIVPGTDERTLLYFPPAARTRLHERQQLSVTTPAGDSLAMRIKQIFPSVQAVPESLQSDVDRQQQAVVVLATPVDPNAAAQVQPGTPVTASVPRWSGGDWVTRAWSSLTHLAVRAAGEIGAKLYGIAAEVVRHHDPDGARR